LSRGDNGQLSRNGQQGQQGSKVSKGSSPRSNAVSRASSRSGARGADSQQLRQTLDRLQQAVDDMRRRRPPSQAGTPQGEAEAGARPTV